MVRMNKFIHHIALIKRSQLFLQSMRLGQSFIVLMRKTKKKERERGRHKNSIKTLRSWLPASKRRSSHFYPL